MSQFVEVRLTLADGRTLAGQQKISSEDAPWLIMLHGWLDNSNSLRPLADNISGYNILIPDLCGHGLSDHRSADSYYYAMDWAYDLHLLIECLRLKRCSLVGHSMGGMIAAAYAAAIPDKVTRIILLDSSAGFSQDTSLFTENLQQAFTRRDQYLTAKKRQWRDIKILPTLYKTRAEHSQISVSQAEYLLQRNINIQGQQFSWRSDPRLQLISPMRLSEAQVVNYISQIKAPVNIVLAEQGMPEIATAVNQRLHYFKQVSLDYLPGGHHFHLEHPVKTATLLQKIM